MQALVFILGLIFGSFLNVVLFRFGTGLGFGGRSKCASCGEILKWYELIPVVSFIIQKGRSRYTGAKLSIQYPIVELLTGFLFLFAFNKVALEMSSVISFEALALFVFLAFVGVHLVLITVYDFKHMIIPHQWSNMLIALSVLSLVIVISPMESWIVVPTLSSVLSGFYVAAPFFLLWMVSKGRWMGFADIKLALAIGWFLPLAQAFTAVVISFWVGAIVGVLLLIIKKSKITRKSAIPFGPFLLLGLALVYYFNWSILDLGALFIF